MLKLKIGNLWSLQLAALLAAGFLAGCAVQDGSSDDKMGRFLVAPGKFVLYDCAQLAQQAATTGKREKELAALIAKAGPGSDGRLVSSIAYRPEYLEVHGEMNELRNAAAAKNCDLVPGASISEKVVR
jgi:hypothetical protein